MSEPNTNLEVSRRNASSVLESLARQDARILEQQKRIDGLINTISTLSNKLINIEHEMFLQKATQMGKGPTVK